MVNIVRASITLGRTIRNAGRMKEIMTVFAKNGFDEFIARSVTARLPDFVLPESKIKIKEELEKGGDKDNYKIIGHRLRLVFEELGPAFIKIGQLLSSREDLFEPGFIDEMKLLRDRVKGIPFSEAKIVIEKGLGKKISDVFSQIDETPIGTASIGVVYRGKLLNGDDVVLKVRRPGIDRVIETDIAIFSFLIQQLEKMSVEAKSLGLSRMVRDFSVGLERELNFNVEALSCKRLKENLARHDIEKIFHIPKIYQEFSGEELLVMEFLDGVPFSDSVRIKEHSTDLHKKLEKGIALFLKTFLQDGFFHADLHGGNFFYLKNGQIGLVDFGLMGSLGKRNRANFIAIIYALLSFNYDNLVYEFLDVAEYEKIPEIDDLIRDVKDVLTPFVGLTVQQTDFSKVLPAIFKTLSTHELYLPREWFIVFRALMTLDGVGKSLGFDFDLFSLLDKEIKVIIKDSFKKEDLIEEGIWASRDLLSSVRSFPRHFKWFVKEWAKNNYAFKIVNSGYEKEISSIAYSIRFLAHSILAGIFIFSGLQFLGREPIMHLAQVPMISWVFWGIALIFLVSHRWHR